MTESNEGAKFLHYRSTNHAQVGDTITVRFAPEARISDDGYYSEAVQRQVTGEVTALNGSRVTFGSITFDLSLSKVNSVELVSRRPKRA